MEIIEAKQPKSLCTCGHSGDGPDSQHAGVNVGGASAEGHGACKIAGCSCVKFTWFAFTLYGYTLAAKFRKSQEGK